MVKVNCAMCVMNVCGPLRYGFKSGKRCFYSTYRVGLAYEKLTIEVLKKLNFKLVHTGGTGDQGQDFTGYWVLPHKKIPVVGEAKICPASVLHIYACSFNYLRSCQNFYL